ncbi:MAG: 3-isopropylmalate dehydratase small subunit [Chitinophagaceae bacterium]
MAYDKFTVLKSTAVPLPIENVDTDQIIPARFLKATERKGFGDNLFRDWRYNGDDTPKKDFVLNNPIYSGKILVGGKNFGSGSSREHAAWAIYDYGFRCVVSSFFADIFKGNSMNIGILPVTVSEGFLDKIFKSIEADPKAEFEVNLGEQVIRILGSKDSSFGGGLEEAFDINGYKKHNLMNGYDDIDYLQAMKSDIKTFAEKSLY